MIIEASGLMRVLLIVGLLGSLLDAWMVTPASAQQAPKGSNLGI
jgi:hypothetical protein